VRILVAGGTGHLGKELVPLLTTRGIHVRVLTRNPERARHQLGDVAEYVAGDVRNPRSLVAALTGVDAVVSALTGFGPGGAGPRAVDYEGNRNLIRAAEVADVPRFVFVSIHRAAAAHVMELTRMKYRVEEALQSSRLDWTIVRPTAFMELWVGIVGDPIVRAGKATVFGRGDNPINFNSARDVACFVELALFDPNLSRVALDVGGPENITFNELVRRIEIAAGRKAVVKHVPLPVMRLSRLLMRPFKPDIAGMIQGGIAFDTTDMSFDSSDLRRRFPQVQLTSLAQVIGPRFGTTETRSTPGLVSGRVQS
jgi:uncharacterized protein YbjT (DUF2867 family)